CLISKQLMCVFGASRRYWRHSTRRSNERVPTTKSERLDMTQHRSWTRIGLFAAPLAAGALILAGCSGSSTASGPEPQTISYAFGATNDQDKAAYTSLANNYEKAHK